MTYAQSTTLSRSRYNRVPRHKRNMPARVREDALKSQGNLIIVLVLVCLLIVIYLLQVNTTNSYSYVINDLNQRQQQLQEEYKVLEVESTRLESNQRLSQEQELSAEYQLPDNIYFD